MKARVGVIGGTGLYQIDGLNDIREIEIETPFGKPSAKITLGTLGDTTLAFLPRHGQGHVLMPSEVPSRANIYALKSLGVEFIIAVNSVGSFKEEIAPGHLLIPDQLIDRTSKRDNTFFGNGIVAHIAFADPFCPSLRDILFRTAGEAGAICHHQGTYLVIEGPAFSTRAESRLYRSWGADVIGMTALPEARLAREAGICYAIIACVSDYDSWHEEKEAVTVSIVLKIMEANIELSKKIIRQAVSIIPHERKCSCSKALKNAIITNPDAINRETKEKLNAIIGKLE